MRVTFILFLFFSVFLFYAFQDGPVKLVNIPKSPVDTFSESCARCHGEEGSTYGKSFANLSDKELKQVVEDMMFGPAYLTPQEIEIDAMTAYNKQIRDGKPFGVIMNAKSFMKGVDDTLRVITSQGGAISVSNSNAKVNQNKNEWEILFVGDKPDSLEITVTKGNESGLVKFPLSMWTE